MTIEHLCIILAVAYGIVCGGVYILISPRQGRTLRRFVRATAVYLGLGVVLSLIFYFVFR